MEYVSGGDLYHLIEQRGRVSEAEARVYFQQIISAIDYCHHNQVTHRDLKPENILLDELNRVKIGDFGLANLMRDGEFFKTSCGSPNYAAPEVLSGSLYCGSEVDIWSCGVVLYALLAGALPFDEARLPLLYEKIKTGQYHMPYHFSEGARDLVARMLTLDPVGRITVGQVKKHPWFTVSLPAYISEGKSTLWGGNGAVCLTELRAYHSKRTIDSEVFEQCMRLPAFIGHEDRVIVLEKLVNRKAGSIGVCYDLLFDARMKELAAMQVAPMPVTKMFTVEEHVDEWEETMDVDLEAPPARPCNWVYGFRCQLDGLSLMNIIFEGFRSFFLEWKIISTFRFIVRTLGYKQFLGELEGKNVTPVDYGSHLKFSLCIYKYEKAFVLDLSLVHGQTLVFLDECARLYQFLILKPQICTY